MSGVISIEVGDVLGASADALVVPIDGSFVPAVGRTERVLGGVGAQFVRRYPEVDLVDEIEAQVDFPVPLGRAVAVELSPPPFRAVLLASMLHHASPLEDAVKRGVVRAAFASALEIAVGLGLGRVAAPVLQGGWRLRPEVAFRAMVDAVGSIPAAPSVVVYCLDPALASSLR